MHKKPYKQTESDTAKIAEKMSTWQPKTSKLRNIDGKFYRLRRGKWVEVPMKWLGHVPDGNTKAKRQPVSRRTRKLKNKST